MSQEIHDDYTPKVSVRLNRFKDRDEVLVTVNSDPDDEDDFYFYKLISAEDGVGFSIDPINHPHEVQIVDNSGIYGGEFLRLGDRSGAFLAHPPKALIGLLFPDGATEVTIPCEARSGEFELSFTLPEGRSLLSLFFKEPLPVLSASESQPDTDRCMNLVTS